MALYKFLFAAMFTLTTLSSIAHTTPAKDAKIIMTHVLEPTRANATKEVKRSDLTLCHDLVVISEGHYLLLIY